MFRVLFLMLLVLAALVAGPIWLDSKVMFVSKPIPKLSK